MFLNHITNVKGCHPIQGVKVLYFSVSQISVTPTEVEVEVWKT